MGQAVQCAELEACGILYRPHMVLNPTTKLYVLYWNYVNKKGACNPFPPVLPPF